MLGVIVINITFNFVVKKTSIEKQTYLPKKKTTQYMLIIMLDKLRDYVQYYVQIQ